MDFQGKLVELKENTMDYAMSLRDEGRTDESNVIRAKANIYDIFFVYFNKAKEECGGSVEKLREIFLKDTDRLITSWKNNLETAKEYNNLSKIMIEESKLEAVAEIMDEFAKLESI